MICKCGHPDKDHSNFGTGKCDHCNCEQYSVEEEEPIGGDLYTDYDPREWGEE